MSLRHIAACCSAVLGRKGQEAKHLADRRAADIVPHVDANDGHRCRGSPKANAHVLLQTRQPPGPIQERRLCDVALVSLAKHPRSQGERLLVGLRGLAPALLEAEVLGKASEPAVGLEDAVLLLSYRSLEVIPEQGLCLHQLPRSALLCQDRRKAEERRIVDLADLLLCLECIVKGLLGLLPLALFRQNGTEVVQQNRVLGLLSEHLPQLSSSFAKFLLLHQAHDSI
mmetsp:Transcript_9313/g.26791  ORF Transcript_9313/g.26791 Transcript_9313/m.26791 type:complete len:227 (+) Transcript_9313:171-851(+)